MLRPFFLSTLCLHNLLCSTHRQRAKVPQSSPIKWSTDKAASYDMFVDRMKACEKHINKNHNLKSRSLASPEHVKNLYGKCKNVLCSFFPLLLSPYWPAVGMLQVERNDA